MEAHPSSSRTTLLMLLGASEWPQFPEFQNSQAFANAARGVRDYFLDPKRFGIPLENTLDAFDSQSASDELDAQIGQFLEQRLATMKVNGQGARDLLVYFVGHGGFVGRDSDFYLAIRRTRMENPRASGLSMLALADTLTEKARHLRRIIILDCCFAAAAFSAFQAGPAQVAIEKSNEAFWVKQRAEGFPTKGTALLCSSSHTSPSLLLPDGSLTMFTKAMLDALAEGMPPQREYLSLRDVKDIAVDFLSERKNAPRPVVLSPDQSEGDVADIPFFPNPCAKEERACQAEEQVRSIIEKERRRQEAMPVNVADQLPLQTTVVVPQPKPRVGTIFVTILRIIFYFIGALIAGICIDLALEPGLSISNYGNNDVRGFWMALIVWTLSIPVLVFVLNRHKQVQLSEKQRIIFVLIAVCVAFLVGGTIEVILSYLMSSAPMVAISIGYTIGFICSISCCVLALW